MFKISRIADYSTTVMCLLAKDPVQRLSAARVSSVTDIPTPTVSKLLKRLNEAQLVNATRGASGGYQLTRAPNEISVADIISAIDGPLAVTECAGPADTCIRVSHCGLRHNWQHINKMVVMLLKRLSVADMCRPLNKIIKIESLEESHE